MMQSPTEYFKALEAERKQLRETNRLLGLQLLELDTEFNTLGRALNVLLDAARLSPASRGVVLSDRDLQNSPEGRDFLERVKNNQRSV